MKTILITGANRGVGKALAILEHARGNAVIAAMRDTDVDLPSGIERLKLDVTREDDLADLAKALDGRGIDRLICNAGVLSGRGGIAGDSGDMTDWATTMAVNVTGVFMTVRAALPALQRGDAAKIGIISSQLGSSTFATGGNYSYKASKAAVLNIGMNLAAELKPEGISVGIYHPGWVRTDMGGSAAAISVEESAAGLTACLDALGLDQTGEFLNWDGRPHAI